MKIKISAERFKKAIESCNVTVSKNNQNNQLKGIYLEAKESKLLLRSTNISTGYEEYIICEVVEEGKVLILCEFLTRIFSSVNIKANSVCEMELKGSICIIKIDKHNIEIKTLNSDNFPNLPTSEGVEIETNIQNLTHGFKNVLFSVSKSDIKPEISGVYVYSDEENITFVGTDSYRLSEKKIKNTKNNANIIMPNLEFIIPEKNIKEFIRLFDDSKEDYTLSLSKNSLSFKSEFEYFVTRLIEGKFPNYRQIIPNETISSSVILKSDLQAALKLVSNFSDKTEQINLEFDKDILNITASNLEMGSVIESINTNTKGDNFSIKVNSRYLEEFLSTVNENSIIIKYTAQNKPIIFQGLQDSSFTYLVMPSYK